MAGFSADSNERRMKLYRAGLSDEEMARKESTTKQAITHWRNRKKLKMNKPLATPNENDVCSIGSKIKPKGRNCGNCEHYEPETICELCGNKESRPNWKGVKYACR